MRKTPTTIKGLINRQEKQFKRIEDKKEGYAYHFRLVSKDIIQPALKSQKRVINLLGCTAELYEKPNCFYFYIGKQGKKVKVTINEDDGDVALRIYEQGTKIMIHNDEIRTGSFTKREIELLFEKAHKHLLSMLA